MTSILTLVGAVGLFLYGMKVMSDAVMELAGSRMRLILASTTSNRVFAVFTGFFITAVIQSSSATTLMVVSFANAGLISLAEAVGLIMGANIGTTVTIWLISILGFKVSMSSIALPLVGAGFLLSLSNRKSVKQLGLFIVGFGLLFIGLQFLKESVPDISNDPQALHFLAEYTSKGYLSVMIFVGIGTVLTLIMQASAATMALTLLMCYQGWIPFDMAAAMVLGENIGTTITANLAALVGNFHAKRAARAHLIFNLIGVVWMLVLFYPFLSLIELVVLWVEGVSPFLSVAAIPVALSLFHSSFNIFNTMLLISFIALIVRLVEWLVPPVAEPEMEIDQPRFLSEDSLKFPETGMKALVDESVRLLNETAYQVITHGLNVHRTDVETNMKLKEIVKLSNNIDIDVDKIYTIKIKTIYSCILEHATKLQSSFTLEQDKVESIRNILIADRMLVHVVKKMKPLHKNVDLYLRSDNPVIRRQYNRLRRRILKVMREIRRTSVSEHPEEHLKHLVSLRIKADQLDVLLTGDVDKLLLSGAISNEMATSLMNDSADAKRISQMLVDIATLFYAPFDTQTYVIDEQQEPTFPSTEKISSNEKDETDDSV